MLPERLQSRIRVQLSLSTPDLEARALATEMAELGKRASERLAQCATLARLGNEQAALQSAEAEPSLLDLCAWLSFEESVAWRQLCMDHGLPTAPPLDDAQLLSVEQLYGKPIDENHPLYRDYRQAIRERDDSRALYVLRSITTVNPSDTNAQAELNRLRSKFMRDALKSVTEYFTKKETEAAVQLMTRMEQVGTAQLKGDRDWEEALRLRALWIQTQSRSRISGHAQRANQAYNAKDWRTCADEVGGARTSERNAGIKAEGAEAEILRTCEKWATELANAAAAEVNARNQIENLREEWSRLGQEAQSGHSADLLRRVNKWIEKGSSTTLPMPIEMTEAANELSRALHRKVVRAHTKHVSVSVLALIAVLTASYFFYESVRSKTEIETALNAIDVPLQNWDFDAANQKISEVNNLANTLELKDITSDKVAKIRQEIVSLKEKEQELATEAAYLSQANATGIDVNNFLEVQRRGNAFNAALTKVGSQAAKRLKTQSGNVDSLIAQCKKFEQDLPKQIDQLSETLEKAIGNNPELAKETTEKIRLLLQTPGVKTIVGTECNDRAMSLTDRSKERLLLDSASENAQRRLSNAKDLKGYLTALQAIHKETPELDVGKAALFVIESKDELNQLPRCLLGPRTAAMWDAAATAEPTNFKLNPEELGIAQRLTQDNLIRGIRIFSIREHTSPEAGVNLSKIVETEYVVGNLTTQTRRVDGLSETVYKGNVLRSSGDLVEMTWSLREFSNNNVSGKEPTEGVPLPEQEYLKRFDRYFYLSADGTIPEQPLRSIERVRKETGSILLRAYHLQELFRLASVRPDLSGLAFSPSAQRDAADLRGITQNNLSSWEFVYSRDKVLLKELSKFHALTSVKYYAEAKFFRSFVGNLRNSGLMLVGYVALDGRTAVCTQPVAAGTILSGLNPDGKPVALFEGIDGSKVRPIANTSAAPFTPLLGLVTSPKDAAETAGTPPTDLIVPPGGWNTLLKGKDF